MWHFVGSALAVVTCLQVQVGTITVIDPGDTLVVVRDLPIHENGKQFAVLAPGEIVTVRAHDGLKLRVSGRYAGSVEMENLRHCDDALQYFEKRIAAEPDQLKWHLAYVRVLLVCGKHEQVAAELKSLRTKHGDSAALWTLAAAYQDLREDYASARARIDQALKFDPNDSAARYTSGVILLKQKDLKGAVAQLDETLRLDPKCLSARVARGWAYFGLKNTEAALADYRAVLKADPENAQALYQRGMVRRDGNDPDINAAIRDFSEVLRLDPKAHWAYEARGVAWNRKKERDKAVADLDQAIRLAPAEASAYKERGNVWNGKKNWHKSLADFNQALRLNPKDAEALCERAWSQGMLKQYDQALAGVNAALALRPADARCFRIRANVYWGMEKTQEALADFTKAMELTPQDYSLYPERAYVHIARKEYELAIADWTSYLQHVPDSADIHSQRATTWETVGQMEKALADWDEAIRLAPDNAQYHIFRGQLLVRLKQKSRALADFSQAIALNHPDPKLYGLRASLHLELGSYALALADLDMFVQKMPNEPMVCATRAMLLTACPDAKYRDGLQAQADAQRALQLWKEDHPLGLRVLAAAQAELGDFDAAIATTNKALAQAPEAEKKDIQRYLDLYKSNQTEHLPPPQKSLATAQVRPTAQEIAAERQILIHYEKQYQELEQEYGAAVNKSSSAFAEAKVSLDAMPTATAEAKQKVEEMKNANTAMAKKYGRHFGYLKFRIDALQQRLKEMEAWQAPGEGPASQPKEMEVRQVPGGEPARQPILTLDSATKGVVGYWRLHVTEEEARREKLELINRDQLIVGKVTSTLSEGEKQKLLESAVRSELKQARKEEQRGLLRVDADGTLYMIFASAEDAAKDRKQRVTKARWSMTQEGGVVLFNVTGSDMFPAKSWLRSIGPNTMVLVEPAGKPGESHRSATHLREMNPAEWAKDIADLSPAAPASK